MSIDFKNLMLSFIIMVLSVILELRFTNYSKDFALISGLIIGRHYWPVKD